MIAVKIGQLVLQANNVHEVIAWRPCGTYTPPAALGFGAAVEISFLVQKPSDARNSDGGGFPLSGPPPQ